MELTEWSWQGYGRKHGAPGIRNRVLVIYTVKCSEFVARRIVEESGHPDVELVGFDGCTDNQYAVDQRSQKARPGSGKPWSGLSTPRG